MGGNLTKKTSSRSSSRFLANSCIMCLLAILADNAGQAGYCQLGMERSLTPEDPLFHSSTRYACLKGRGIPMPPCSSSPTPDRLRHSVNRYSCCFSFLHNHHRTAATPHDIKADGHEVHACCSLEIACSLATHREPISLTSNATARMVGLGLGL